MKRVVITGVGAVTPIGIGKEEMWENIKAGVCGIDRITRFDVSDYPCQIAAEVKGFDPADFMDKKEAKRMDLFVQYAVAGAKLAAEDAKLYIEDENPERMGCIIGS